MDKIVVLVVIALLVICSFYKMVVKVRDINMSILETLRAIYLLLFAAFLVFLLYVGVSTGIM